MEINRLLVKPLWQRRTRNDSASALTDRPATVSFNVDRPMEDDMASVRLMKQSDFLDEKYPSSHLIYSTAYRSMRKVYKFNEETQKPEFDHYEDLYRTSLGLQMATLTNKTTICHTNDIWFGNEFGGEDDTERLARIKAWWNVTGMNRALMLAAESWFGTGDGAIYLYIKDRKIHYKVFSFEDGSNLTYRRREGIGVRRFSVNGRTAVELYLPDAVQMWIYDAKATEEDGYTVLATSEDGYALVENTPNPIGYSMFFYHREPDVCWGPGQQNADDLDGLLSDGFESGKLFFFPMLFLKGDVEELPELDNVTKTLGAGDESADAKMLTPPDNSSMYDTSWTRAARAYCDATNSVMLRPEDLKGQNDSAAYLRLLFFPETQWAEKYYSRLDGFMRELLGGFQRLVGILEGDEEGYTDLKFSYRLTPYIPQNLAEEINNINTSYSMGTISGATAREEHPLANPNEEARIRAEMEEEQRRQAMQVVVPEGQPAQPVLA